MQASLMGSLKANPVQSCPKKRLTCRVSNWKMCSTPATRILKKTCSTNWPGQAGEAARHLGPREQQRKHLLRVRKEARVADALHAFCMQICLPFLPRSLLLFLPLSLTAVEDEPNCMMSRSSAECRYSLGTGLREEGGGSGARDEAWGVRIARRKRRRKGCAWR